MKLEDYSNLRLKDKVIWRHEDGFELVSPGPIQSNGDALIQCEGWQVYIVELSKLEVFEAHD